MTTIDQQPFNRLFAGSYLKVKNYLKSLCRNATEAEDITQDTFVRAFRFYHTFDHRSSFDAWVMQIARNQYLDSIRRTRSRVQTVQFDQEHPDALESQIADPKQSPEAVVLHRELDPELVEAISALNEAQQQLLQWIAVDQLTYTEVSNRLGIPLGTVKSRYGRALKEARQFAKQNRSSHQVTHIAGNLAPQF